MPMPVQDVDERAKFQLSSPSLSGLSCSIDKLPELNPAFLTGLHSEGPRYAIASGSFLCPSPSKRFFLGCVNSRPEAGSRSLGKAFCTGFDCWWV